MSKKTEQKRGMEKLVLALMISFILFSSYASAFGIGAAYHSARPLEIPSGETKEITFNLQNMPGPGNITARGSIKKGSEILELIDSDDIFIPVGGSVDVKARVSVPSDAKIGDIYPVEVTFTTVTTSEAGTFGFGSSIGRSFDVIIVPTAEETARLERQAQITQWAIYLIIGGIIILIIIIILIVLKKKK